jgi:dipeptidyl aminopeptidase/acylaminoacyl peptidase
VFAASAKDGGDVACVTKTTVAESAVTWAPDSRRIAYVSTRGGDRRIFIYDFGATTETALTGGASASQDEEPQFSPDGKTLAFVRNQRELRAIDLASKQERLLAEGRFGDALGAETPTWSPDGKWIAVLAIGDRSFTNVHLAPVAGGAEAGELPRTLCRAPPEPDGTFPTRGSAPRRPVARVIHPAHAEIPRRSVS